MNEIPMTNRIIAAAAHAGFYLGGVGFLLIPYLIKTVWRHDDFIAGHARQALYMQIGAFLFSLLVIPLAFILSPETAAFIGIGFLTVAWALFALVAAFKALIGEEYVYPMLKLVNLG